MEKCINQGVNVGNSSFTDIDYADDAVLFAEDPGLWSRVLHSYEATASSVGLHANWRKTKVQNIGAGPAPDSVLMGDQTVEPVTKFIHISRLRCGF